MGAAEKDDSAASTSLLQALISLADEMRASRDSVQRLERTVERFVVATERQLASGQAVKRQAERALRGLDADKIAAMNKRLDRKLGGKP